MMFELETELSEAAQSFWAKTGLEETPALGMNLPQHMLDSAMVAQHLWQNWVSSGSKKWAEEALNLTSQETESLVCWLVGTHDIGKATPEFAGQLDSRNKPELFKYRQDIENAGFEFIRDLTEVDGRCPHSQYSQAIISSWLLHIFEDVSEISVKSLAQVSGAHHGKPADPITPNRDQELLDRVMEQAKYQNWLDAWDELLNFISQETEVYPALEKVLTHGGLKSDLQFFFTGLTIMCDWIASNPDYFPYGEVKDQRERVQKAFESLNLSQPWQPEDFSSLTPEEIYSRRFNLPNGAVLRPMQRVVVDAAHTLTDGGLICIEAPMGQGKTEAGLVAAEILAQQSGKNGLMFAAPTQATADALFNRVAQWGRKAAHGNETISMFLGHSKSSLNENFQKMRFAKIHAFEGQKNGEEEAQVIAHQWFSRKKGVLSNFVVGTVDQVLMMALASRHVMLRHLGLGEKVVVIDEVHAYDAYMNVYLENALEWLGKMRAPVILMSATLPGNARRRLMQAYVRGLGVMGVARASKGRRLRGGKRAASAEMDVLDLDYPVIHTVSSLNSGKPQKWQVEQPAEQKEFSLRLIDDSFAELDRVLAPLDSEGGCAAIICNTVGRAQEVYKHLQTSYSADELMLVHSRFLARDRVKNEQTLIERLGKDGRRSAGRPEKFIVVGTQVIEQSLDIDFDVMITDHAPIDLVLQRMGRLHRHERGGERPVHFAQPVCYVRGVEELGSSEKVPVFSKVLELIYDRSILLASYAVLLPYFDVEPLYIPADMSALVQGAYTDSCEVPAAWQEEFAVAVAKKKDEQSESRKKAACYSIRPQSGAEYMWDFYKTSEIGTDADELKAQAKVRDTDETLEVLVVQSDDGVMYRPLDAEYADQLFDRNSPEKPDWKLANVLAGSSIRLPYQFADNGKPAKANPFDRALEELEQNQFASWQKHYLLKGQLALVLDSNFECILAGKHVRYSREFGLEVLKDWLG